MKSRSQKRRHATPQHRRAATRRVLNKARLLFLILGVLSMVLGAVLALLAFFQSQPMTQPIWMICLAYAGGGLLLLLLHTLLGLSKRGRRRKGGGRPAEEIPERTAPARGKDGMVLVLVLVLLGMTTVLLFHVQYTARMTQQADLKRWQDARLRTALIDEGLHRARQLADDDDLAVDHLEKAWLDNTETVRPDGITTISRVTDLNRYVDINNLNLGDDFSRQNHTERFLIEAMTKAGDFTPIERTVALTDWMDADDDGIRESEFYLAMDPPYAVPDTSLQSWNELLLIHGFTTEYLERKPLHVIGRPFSANIVDLLALVPGPRNQPVPVNINTAPIEVLESIFGLEQEPLAQYIRIARADRPFRSIDALLAQADQALFTELAPFLSVRSTHFLIEVRAFEERRNAGLRAVVHREPEGRVHILQWVL